MIAAGKPDSRYAVEQLAQAVCIAREGIIAALIAHMLRIQGNEHAVILRHAQLCEILHIGAVGFVRPFAGGGNDEREAAVRAAGPFNQRSKHLICAFVEAAADNKQSTFHMRLFLLAVQLVISAVTR